MIYLESLNSRIMLRVTLCVVVAFTALSAGSLLRQTRELSLLRGASEVRVVAAARKDDIPQRCIDNSVTPVSCVDATEKDALIPHPDDCGLFYYCVNALHDPVCRACPPGLHFSPTEHVCDQPEHAGCEAQS